MLIEKGVTKSFKQEMITYFLKHIYLGCIGSQLQLVGSSSLTRV